MRYKISHEWLRTQSNAECNIFSPSSHLTGGPRRLNYRLRAHSSKCLEIRRHFYRVRKKNNLLELVDIAIETTEKINIFGKWPTLNASCFVVLAPVAICRAVTVCTQELRCQNWEQIFQAQEIKTRSKYFLFVLKIFFVFVFVRATFCQICWRIFFEHFQGWNVGD